MKNLKVDLIIRRYMKGNRQGYTDAQILDMYERMLRMINTERILWKIKWQEVR